MKQGPPPPEPDESAARQVRALLAVCMAKAKAALQRRHDRAVRVAKLRAQKQRERGQVDE